MRKVTPEMRFLQVTTHQLICNIQSIEAAQQAGHRATDLQPS